MLTSVDGIRLRIRIIVAFTIPVLLGIIFRFAWVQLVKHEYYTAKKTGRFNKNTKVTGIRGRIFDRNGFLLVGNTLCYYIDCDPYNLGFPAKERLQTARIFSKHFGRPVNYYAQRLFPKRKFNQKTGKTEEVYFRNLLLERWASPEQKDRFQQEITEYFKSVIQRNRRERKEAIALKKKDVPKKIKYPNNFVRYLDNSYRIHPKRQLAANILGFVNFEGTQAIAQSGLEQLLDMQMTPQESTYTYDLRDGKKNKYDLQKKVIHNGGDVYLTISEPIQAILEEELDAAFSKWRPDVIYAAIADPKTGEILALAQRPTFDPNDRSTFTPNAFRNRLIEDTYEPGSLMKPFTVAKALDWNTVKPDDVIDCERGTWYYLGAKTSDSHAYDKLDITGIIQKSSNIGTAKIALQMGIDRLMQTLRLFRFGEKSGLNFKYETSGRVAYPRKGDGISITRYSFGYGVRVSPLQLIRAYIGLASPAGVPDLQIIKRIVDPETGKETLPRKKPAKRVFENEQARRQLVDMMITVTQKGGTSVNAAIPGFHVAGKTGTSRKYVPELKGYSTSKYYASFVGFAPAHDPRLVMLVTFDSPKGSIYGGTVAGPVFSKTVQRILQYWNAPQDYAVEEKSKAPKK